MVHNPDLSAGSRISPSACDAGGSEPYWEIEDTGPAEVAQASKQVQKWFCGRFTPVVLLSYSRQVVVVRRLVVSWFSYLC